MKYKNRLIVPTAVTISLVMSNLTISADEIDEQDNIYTESQDINTIDDSSKETIDSAEHYKSSNDTNVAEDIESLQNNDEINVSEENIHQQENSDQKDAFENDEVDSEDLSEEQINAEASLPEFDKNDLHKDGTNEVDNTEGDVNPEISEEAKELESGSSEAGSVENDTDSFPLEDDNSNTKNEDSNNDLYETPDKKDDLKISDDNNISDSLDNNENWEDIPQEITEKTEIDNDIIDKSNEISSPDSIEDESSKSEDKEDSLDEDKQPQMMMSSFSMNTDEKIQTLAANAKESVFYAARVKDGPNSGRYSPISSTDGKPLGWLENRTLYVTAESSYGGDKYYRIHSGYDGPMQGWVKEEDLRLFNISESKNYNKTFDIRLDRHYLTTDPWGTANQYIKRLDKYGDESFKASKTLNLGAHTYYYGKIGSDYGWLEQSRLVDTSVNPYYTSAFNAVKVKSGSNSGRYSPVTSNNSKTIGNWLKDRTLFATEKAKYQGTTYYKVHSGIDGPMQGWIKSEDLSLFNTSKPKAYSKTFDIQLDRHHLLTDPWGTKKQYIKRLDSYGDVPFKTSKVMDLGNHTYYYGKIGNDYGWLEQSRLVDTSVNPYYTSAFNAVKIKSGSNSGRYSPITNNNSKTIGNWLKNRTLFATEKAKYKGTTYYKIHSGIDGPMQGWVKSEDLRLFNTSKPVSHSNSYGIYQPNHHLLTDPWGTATQQIKRLGAYGSGAVFKAEKSMKLGNHTYYYGKIGNDYGWVEQSRLTDVPSTPPAPRPETTTVRYGQSLNQVLNIQMNLNAKPQAWVSGGGWRNATRSEVKNFLDTSHQKSGTWDYTFLNLDQRQGISASVLNRQLLSNRGILTNQGNAFSRAASTHGVNEVYLISHAVLETGHGSSQLAQGVRLDSNGNISNSGKQYYNMYGIGAVDHNALLGGARYAQRMGWDTPEKAIIGGAGFVSQNYFNRGQNTLYAMRWNPRNPGTYQYATDVNWAYATARNLESYYKALGVTGRYFTRYIF